MPDEPRRLDLRLLQEIRANMEQLRTETSARFDALDRRFDILERGSDGHALLLNLVAGAVKSHERRIDAIEAGNDG